MAIYKRPLCLCHAIKIRIKYWVHTELCLTPINHTAVRTLPYLDREAKPAYQPP